MSKCVQSVFLWEFYDFRSYIYIFRPFLGLFLYMVLEDVLISLFYK